jgi:predicted PurR-regulated permease PerM
LSIRGPGRPVAARLALVRVLRFCSPIGRYARAYLLVAAAVAVLVALVLWIGGVNANLAGV